MHFDDVVATGAQVATQLNSSQVLAFLAVVTVLVLLAMVWRAWFWVFGQIPARGSRRSPGRARRDQGPKRGGRGGDGR